MIPTVIVVCFVVVATTGVFQSVVMVIATQNAIRQRDELRKERREMMGRFDGRVSDMMNQLVPALSDPYSVMECGDHFHVIGGGNFMSEEIPAREIADAIAADMNAKARRGVS